MANVINNDSISFDNQLVMQQNDLLQETLKREILRDIEKGIYTIEQKSKYFKFKTKMKKEDYLEMLDEAVFFGIANKMIKMNYGRPFNKQATISSENKKIAALEKNFDGYNNDLTTYGRRGFKRAMFDSQMQVFVDFNKKKDRACSTILMPENILGYYIDDNNELVHLRFMTTFSTRDPNTVFGRLTLRNIWIFNKEENGTVTYSLYKEDKNNVGSFLEEKKDQKYVKDFIPLFSFYPDATEIPFAPDLLFRDLCEKNAEYFRSQTLQGRYLAQGRIPILMMKGVDEGTQGVSIGKSLALLASDPQADMKYVEISGQSLQAGDRYNDRLLNEMSQLGVELLNRKVNFSATGAAIDNAQNLSLLTSYAIQYESFLKKLTVVMAFWDEINSLEDLNKILENEDNNQDYKFVLSIDTDFSTVVDQAELQFIQNMRAIGDISGKTITDYAKGKGLLPPEYDYDDDQERMMQNGFMQVDNSVLVDTNIDNKLKNNPDNPTGMEEELPTS